MTSALQSIPCFTTVVDGKKKCINAFPDIVNRTNTNILVKRYHSVNKSQTLKIESTTTEVIRQKNQCPQNTMEKMFMTARL